MNTTAICPEINYHGMNAHYTVRDANVEELKRSSFTRAIVFTSIDNQTELIVDVTDVPDEDALQTAYDRADHDMWNPQHYSVMVKPVPPPHIKTITLKVTVEKAGEIVCAFEQCFWVDLLDDGMPTWKEWRYGVAMDVIREKYGRLAGETLRYYIDGEEWRFDPENPSDPY